MAVKPIYGKKGLNLYLSGSCMVTFRIYEKSKIVILAKLFETTYVFTKKLTEARSRKLP